ncbi:hypothetical protein [Cerasicoccus fimbriatus]|uniref:hypothetical protein n=1 Tax=Cerasicoccus fimbriatus TaxID=3014554 RepID=UPI0022B57AAE|nr:hypothetical protein [Cerasicoccus sp. TK19100]
MSTESTSDYALDAEIMLKLKKIDAKSPEFLEQFLELYAQSPKNPLLLVKANALRHSVSKSGNEDLLRTANETLLQVTIDMIESGHSWSVLYNQMRYDAYRYNPKYAENSYARLRAAMEARVLNDQMLDKKASKFYYIASKYGLSFVKFSPEVQAIIRQHYREHAPGHVHNDFMGWLHRRKDTVNLSSEINYAVDQFAFSSEKRTLITVDKYAQFFLAANEPEKAINLITEAAAHYDLEPSELPLDNKITYVRALLANGQYESVIAEVDSILATTDGEFVTYLELWYDGEFRKSSFIPASKRLLTYKDEALEKMNQAQENGRKDSLVQ